MRFQVPAGAFFGGLKAVSTCLIQIKAISARVDRGSAMIPDRATSITGSQCPMKVG